MALDPIQQGIPTPNINTQPTPTPDPAEQQIRTMRGDLGSTTTLPTFDADEPVFTPETTSQIPAQMTPQISAQTSTPTPVQDQSVPSVDQLVGEGHKKMPLAFIGGAAGFVILAAVGYFVIYPMFSGNATAPVDETPAAPSGGEPRPETGRETPTQPVVLGRVHKTQFINPPIATVSEALAAITQAEIKGVLVRVGQTAKPGATEIVFTNSQGVPLSAADLLKVLTPDLESADTDLLEADITVFIFKDGSGVWPGYIAEFKAESAPEVPVFTSDLEAINLKNFFVVDPGKLAPFKSGTVGNIPDRYSAGTTAGASLGYLVTKNKLLISTSFAGMKEALRLMGL